MPNLHLFRRVFEIIPAPGILLLPDSPVFTIVAVNQAYYDIVNTSEHELLGKGVFEAFPENPEDLLSKGVENLTNSLNYVIAHNHSHKLPVQKYDIPIRGTSKFKVKYANIQNIPIMDDQNKITHILHTIEDVTDKKQLELSLEIQRQRFNDLYSQAPSCMGIIKGPEYIYELANPLYLDLIGVRDIIGKTVKEVLPELEAQGIFEILDKVYQTGETFSGNEMLVKFDHHRTGELVDRYLNFIYQASRNDVGVIDGILFFASDVTELVLSRKKAEESEKRYKELIQNLPIATYSCDLNGRLLFYNKAAATLWGREPEIGDDGWCRSWNIYSENGNPLPLDLYSMAVMDKGKISNEEIIVERPNGEKTYVLPYPVPFKDSSGKVTGVVNMLIDNTESKQAEKILRESELKYRQIVETAQEGIWVIDESNKTTFVNNKLCEILEYSREEMMGKDIDFFMDETSQKIAFPMLQKKEGEYLHQKPFKYISKSGKKVWTSLSANPLFDEEGAYKGSLAMVTDITRRRNTEVQLVKLNKDLAIQNKEMERHAAELHLANKELIKANKELDRFVYSVSHDLRSPLTSILGLLSFIDEDSNEPDTLLHINMIRNSINRLDAFIKNILHYSQNNRTELEIQKIPVEKTIQEIIDSVRNMKKAVKISFIINIIEEYPFYSDPHRFNTILENLVTNSIKYHKKDAGERFLKISGVSGKDELKLNISDNGLGIASEFHEKIFQMFYRLPGSTEGSGLGLYIVKESIEKMRGTIEVYSEEGVGTTFYIELKNLKP